jgi:hypothetical protein
LAENGTSLAPSVSTSWASVYARLACVILAAWWPYWQDRKRSPFKRDR